jgi:hypothetical protein
MDLNSRGEIPMWKRRELLCALATGAAGLSVVGSRADAAQAGSGDDEHKHAAIMKTCCDICSDCAKACNKAFHHCLTQAALGKQQHAKMAQTVVDCADFCALSAKLISRESAMMALSCGACADACQRCAQECAALADPEMKECLAACTRCEESCRNMLKAMGVGGGR